MTTRFLFFTFGLLIIFLSLGWGNQEVETKLKAQNTILTRKDNLLKDVRETRRKEKEMRKRKRKTRRLKQKKKGNHKNKINKKRRNKIRKSKQRLKKLPNGETSRNKLRMRQKKRTRILKKIQRKRGQKPRKCARQIPILETCLENLVNSLSFERDQITNFLAQYTRIKVFANLIFNKAGKKGNLNKSSNTLLEALGGNESNPACAGQQMSRGSRNAAVDSYKKLASCSKTIEASCQIPQNTYCTSSLDICNATYQEIKTKNKQCITKTIEQDNACTCWYEAITLINLAKLKSSTCNAKNPTAAVKQIKVACISTFSGCKKAEDASIGYIVTCRTCNFSAGECNLTPQAATRTTSAESEGAATTHNGLAKALERVAACSREWTPWSEWSQCSTTCGIGTKTRIRSCLPEPPCPGVTEETMVCSNDQPCGEFGTQQKCFLKDTDIQTLLNIGRNHNGQDATPEWEIMNDGRHLLETVNTRPSVGLSNLGPQGDLSKPVSFSGRIYSTDDNDDDVIGLVFGFSNERNFFVIASAQQNPGPTNWYVGRLHATCGESCESSTTISDAIWQPTLHPNDITVLSTGSDYWHNGKKYNFTTCFDPSKLLLSVNITDVTDENNVESVLESGIISAKTNDAVVNEVSRRGGYVGVYVDSQMDTNWDNLHCLNCNLSIV